MGKGQNVSPRSEKSCERQSLLPDREADAACRHVFVHGTCTLCLPGSWLETNREAELLLGRGALLASEGSAPAG